MMFANAPIGVVVVGRDESSQKFTLNDQRLLTLFANMVSPAVRSAQLLVQRDRAVQEAERANQVKTRFLASVTHELRTPLNLVINNMDFMRIGSFGEVNEEQGKRLDQTIRGAEHLLYLINDLLDASKIEAGEMQLHIQPSDVYRVIEDSVDSASLAIEKMDKEERITLQVEAEEGLPEVPMDARRIRQVLINLLTNAIKFTQIGEVKLQVSKQNDGVQFVVSDTGMGIAPDEMGLLFEAFERTSEAKSHNIEGTGLGLPISRFLVRSHGGDILVESIQGEGSIFSFVLPLETPSDTDSKLFDTATKIDTQIMEVLSVKAN
jgi:signal transduction histidine kinase